MESAQKKSLMTRLFGDKIQSDVNPKCLFREEWECEKRLAYHNLATVIVSLLPKSLQGFELTEKIARHLFWSCPDAIKPWMEANPEPKFDRDAFLHYLCEQMLEKEKGGEQ